MSRTSDAQAKREADNVLSPTEVPKYDAAKNKTQARGDLAITFDDPQVQTRLSSVVRASFEFHKHHHGLTQAELRDQVGISSTTLNRILNGGTINVEHAVRLYNRFKFNLKKALPVEVHDFIAHYMNLPDVPGTDHVFKDRVRAIAIQLRTKFKAQCPDQRLEILVARVSDDLDEIKAESQEIEDAIIKELFDSFQKP